LIDTLNQHEHDERKRNVPNVKRGFSIHDGN
jgi:hypothetical protein